MTATATNRRSANRLLGFSLVISREQLLEGLAAVMPAVPSKACLPILGNLKLEAITGGLRLTATDLDLSIATMVPADVIDEGACTLPAKRLAAIAKELPPAPVRIQNATNGRISIACGRASFTLHSLPADEWPTLADVDFTAGQMTAGLLAGMVAQTAFAVSSEESRPILNGVLCERSGDSLRFVATNGHKLAYVERPAVVSSISPAFTSHIVPPHALQQIGRLFGEEEEVELGLGENHLAFRSERTTLTTRLIEGPYPPYSSVIPKKHSRRVIVDRVALTSAVKRCVPIASGETHRIKLTIGGTKDNAAGTLWLEASTPDIGSASDELAARIETEAESTLVLGMNANYLLQVLAVIGTDELELNAGDGRRAIVFRPYDDNQAGERFYLVMPMQVVE